jgi:hypothetical protein
MQGNQIASASSRTPFAASSVRVLFVAASAQNYLCDGIFLGLRSLLGNNVVDYPRMDAMYETLSLAQRRELYGRGFSLYGLLPDLAVDRVDIEHKLAEGYFDVAIFSDIHRTFGRYLELLPLLGRVRVAVLDGCDTPAMYPYSGNYWRRPERWFLPRAHTRHLYFKREWTNETLRSRYFHLLPGGAFRRVRPPNNLRSIAFSFPDEKILRPDERVVKRALFAQHIVDPEVRARVHGASSSYAFEDERDYYEDLRGARFGVTMKRGGWDCLRHYEIAANGAVPCFRSLHEKPASCAPHGLGDANCVSYSSADELLGRVESMSEDEYMRLRAGALQWARENSTRTRALQVLRELGFSIEYQPT